MNILEVKNITKIINGKVILKNINFKLEEKTIFGIIGNNGSGKSTLLKLILGIYKSSKGNVSINGYNVINNPKKALKNVGAVIDNPNLYPYLTGRKNLEYINKLEKNISKSKIEDIIKILNMESYIDNVVNTFSLGMKQRLALALALINKPKLLILDEPLNGLDPVGIKELNKILNYLKEKKNITIIISSHILSELESICDYVGILENKTMNNIINLTKTEDSLENIFFGRINE